MTPRCGCGRRHVLVGGLAAAFASTARAAPKPRFIDVHHHLVPPAWVDAVRRAKLDNPPMVSWTPEKSLEDMDKAGTATAILSPMPPQVGFLPATEAAKVAREVERMGTPTGQGSSRPLWCLRDVADALHR